MSRTAAVGTAPSDSRHGPLGLRDRLEATFTPAGLGAALSTYPPGHAYLLAVGLALDIAVGRDHAVRLDDFPGGRWHRDGVRLGPTALEVLRYPPTGDRDLWVRHGPAGPPPHHAVPAHPVSAPGPGVAAPSTAPGSPGGVT